MTTMNDMELNLVNGGAELSEPFEKLMEYLDNYDVTKDPFYFPDHKLPWDVSRLRPKDLENLVDAAKHNMELNDMELNQVSGGEDEVIPDELKKLLEEIEKQNHLPVPDITLPRPSYLDPKNGPLNVMVYPYTEK